MNTLHLICLISAILAAVGAINWLLTAWGFNLVEKLTGNSETLNKIVYTLVGLAGIATLVCQVKWAMKPDFNK